MSEQKEKKQHKKEKREREMNNQFTLVHPSQPKSYVNFNFNFLQIFTSDTTIIGSWNIRHPDTPDTPPPPSIFIASFANLSEFAQHNLTTELCSEPTDRGCNFYASLKYGGI